VFIDLQSFTITFTCVLDHSIIFAVVVHIAFVM